MIQVMRIPMAKTKLSALSKDERVFLFLLGYVANQIMMLEKLALFSSNRDPQEFLDAHANGIQQQMLLRLMIGALNEAWRVIVTRFNKNPIAKEYRPLLDDDGQQALKGLNRQFGSSNLLTRLRTNYAFHHPQSDDVEAAFLDASDAFVVMVQKRLDEVNRQTRGLAPLVAFVACLCYQKYLSAGSSTCSGGILTFEASEGVP